MNSKYDDKLFKGASAKIFENARELRKNATPTEDLLWQELRNRKLCSFKFRRQHPIERFIVDFYCAQHRLAVEIDGDVHAEQREYDAARTEWLEARGYRVIRFTNDQVFRQLPAVLETILAACPEDTSDEA